MNVYKLKLEVLNPLIITKRSMGRFLEHEFLYLPASAIRGAVLSASADLRMEWENPSLVFHPAYPVQRNKAFPAHPLTFELKDEEESLHVPVGLDWFDLPDISKIRPPKEVKKKYFFLAMPAGGSLIHKKNGSTYSKLKLGYISVDSVGIRRSLKTAEPTILYSYIGITPGTKFEGLIVDPEERTDISMFPTRVRIGRGISRGFGETRLTVEKVDLERIKDEVEKRLNSLSHTTVLRVLSPFFLREEFFRDLRPKKVLEGVRYGFVLSTGSTAVSGYSIAGNLPKPEIRRCLAPGSLLFFEKVDLPRVVEMVLLGIGPFGHAGLNIVEVFPREPGCAY